MSNHRIERIEVFPVRLPMKAVLTLPRGPSRTLAEGKRNALVKITDSEGNVETERTGGNGRDIDLLLGAQLHDRPLPILLLDLGQGQV